MPRLCLVFKTMCLVCLGSRHISSIFPWYFDLATYFCWDLWDPPYFSYWWCHSKDQNHIEDLIFMIWGHDLCSCLYICLSFFPSVCQSLCLPIRLSVCLPVGISVCPSVCLSVCSSITGCKYIKLLQQIQWTSFGWIENLVQYKIWD